MRQRYECVLLEPRPFIKTIPPFYASSTPFHLLMHRQHQPAFYYNTTPPFFILPVSYLNSSPLYSTKTRLRASTVRGLAPGSTVPGRGPAPSVLAAAVSKSRALARLAGGTRTGSAGRDLLGACWSWRSRGCGGSSAGPEGGLTARATVGGCRAAPAVDGAAIAEGRAQAGAA